MATVLLVEDNQANQRLFRMVLESMGHSVTCACTGEEGWALLAGGGFELVLLDMHLPGLDGFTLASRIKSLYGDAVIVIAVTALAMEADRQRALASGCDAFITKPISVPDFRATIEALLEGRR
jgi:two-component system cell cycle response regulator DivK